MYTMAEFRTMYYGPMDREYHEAATETPAAPAVEEAIFPISQLGETVPEQDPTGRFKNIIQSTQAAIRGGAGTIQLVLMTPMESAIGGRPKAYGKEVREALKEVALASQVNIAGVELPTSLNNLAGFDYQQLVFSDEKRKQSLDEVKDAIKFAADVGKGGGVDIVSWEFPRSVNEARWNDPNKPEKERKFKQEGEQRIGWLVDERTGRTVQFRKDEVQHIPYKKDNFEKMEPKEEEYAREKPLALNEFTWDDFKKWADKESQKQGKTITPEELYIKVQLEGQIKSLEGWRATYLDNAEKMHGQKIDAEENLKHARTEEQKKAAQKTLREAEEKFKDFLNTAYGQAQQIEELKERIRHLKPIEDYAMKRSTRTYAEAGITAMKEYETGREKGTITKPLYVGPEIGWPGYFGSHPDEFVQLIKKSRDEMVNLLTNPKIKQIRPDGKEEVIENIYFDPGMDREKAKEQADKHIKGMFDTSHMGMWLSHFKPITDPNTGVMETEDRRIQRFRKWYTEQVETLAKSGVVGGIQLVDSMSGAHGHLPPGQGIFPVKETAQIFKDNKFSGYLVSEGHEEEKFGEGRIRMKTWQMAGAPVGAGYFGGPPLRWGQVEHAYFGKTYSPMFMFGGYAPSNEFKLWSEIPLE
ncbi:Uncharacterised protein [uncultured archaeon]|nr:Uncharacterised protein [uncultured archaeon]